ncbi:MbtH protein [Kitasatospora sp. MAP12-15]|uniref:MbtH family protein n=1 Tax=unclassified Kitasatospora TaxID=2633591 RepID=UPI002474849F|nr:MbtH family protein [Kitasatospora sp. MAP12-44]MDH6109615.1 MbtH protein [Kitasatospora sp. MAP12-44]
MANPFDDPQATFVVLVNDEGQHSLWPVATAVPEGWTVAHQADTRERCVEYVNATWTDLRPRSLVLAMKAAAADSTA